MWHCDNYVTGELKKLQDIYGCFFKQNSLLQPKYPVQAWNAKVHHDIDPILWS